MTKAEALATNYNKKELAEKVIELSEKLEEMKGVEAQVSASVESLKDGAPAVGLHRREDGMFQLVRIVYDITQNAAAIIELVDFSSDQQIAAGKLVKEAGEVFSKATGVNYYK